MADDNITIETVLDPESLKISAGQFADEVLDKISSGIGTVATIFGQAFARSATSSLADISKTMAGFPNPISSNEGALSALTGSAERNSDRPNEKLDQMKQYIREDMMSKDYSSMIFSDDKSFKDIYDKSLKAAQVKFGITLDDKSTEELFEEVRTTGRQIRSILSGVLKEPGESLFKILGEEWAMNRAAQVAASSIRGFGRIVENHITDVNKKATQVSVNWLGGPEEQASSMLNISEALERYRSQVWDSVKATGLSESAIDSLVQSFDNAGVNALGFGKRMEHFSELAERSSDVLAETAFIIKGTGLSFEEGARQMSFGMRNLGLDQEGAIRSFGIMSEVASDTGESLSKVTSNIQRGREQLKFYGDTTQGVAQAYAKLLKTVGEGRADWASEFLDTIIQGVGSMNSGLAAFIGQASGIGRGQGAIASMLEVEEKIASGDIQGVLDAVTEQIETISGSPLLTRQEAIDTGKQDQFFLQRELLDKFGFGAGGRDATTRLLETLARGQQVSAQQFSGARGVEELRGRGENIVRAEEGGITMLANVAEAAGALAATKESARIFFDSSAQFQNTVNLLTEQFPKLAEIIKGTGEQNNLQKNIGMIDVPENIPEAQVQDAESVLRKSSALADVANLSAEGQTAETERIIKSANDSVNDTARQKQSVQEVLSPVARELPDSNSELEQVFKGTANNVKDLTDSIKTFIELQKEKERTNNEKSKEPAQFIINIKLGEETITKQVRVMLSDNNKFIVNA